MNAGLSDLSVLFSDCGLPNVKAGFSVLSFVGFENVNAGFCAFSVVCSVDGLPKLKSGFSLLDSDDGFPKLKVGLVASLAVVALPKENPVSGNFSVDAGAAVVFALFSLLTLPKLKGCDALLSASLNLNTSSLICLLKVNVGPLISISESESESESSFFAGLGPKLKGEFLITGFELKENDGPWILTSSSESESESES